MKDAGVYYVVNTAFQIGSTPYAVGEVISSESYFSLPDDERKYVTQLTFISEQQNKTYYYCREGYTTTSGHNITSDDISGGTTCSDASTVPVGVVINAEKYGALPNDQRNFTIHGISPTETSTLFVSRESNIYDLSKEKIITVIYQYDYDETDGSGNVTPISERHVVNIHLTFKSGIPTVADISQPELILPGDKISLRDPAVTPGAYEVTGGGWELFETQRDAESHSNGIEYDPTNDKLYWYQDGYYVSYYAKSYSGRTYSNSVPVSVANYHDLADVMSDENKDHHMYIDNINVKRDPKIYINDYSASGKNGLDLFKNLYDLSLLTKDSVGVTAGKVTAEGPLNGHALLSTQTRAERNLEFFLRTDINHTGTWTPIGYNGVCDDPTTKDVDEALSGETKGTCFDGVLHGDGHTISGLDKSLFNYLCGEVYNLGVTGTFTGGGIAEQGGGYVESCWVNTTGEPDGSKRAVFGNPSAASGYKQIVNSYCQTGKTYNTTDTGNHGLATAMSAEQFYNGTVAYDLNNFYLYKRYSDKRVNSGLAYQYWKSGEAEPQTAYYADNADLCSSGYNGIKYVEDRFKDGDFRFAVGNTSGLENERHWVETITSSGATKEEDRWSPIWPDDYLFFGQQLTYGYSDTESHQPLPSAIVKNDNNRLPDSEKNNRVYRAPAYYQSKEMGVAHFNPTAYLAQNKRGDASIKAYPNMTAIDFAGHYYGTNETYGTYRLGFVDGKFYTPLLDDDGLDEITNCDETKNLLVYAPASENNAKTYGVLTDYFVDPAYASYYDNSNNYRRVLKNDMSIYGHLVQSNLIATNDHLLVDKQAFNCPIAYNFNEDYRMWYQRIPDEQEYVAPVWSGSPAVRSSKGWQGVSIPFTAELVTTNDKGEITHFYSGSETSKNSTGSKIGHEYWLREFKGVTTAMAGEPAAEVAKAFFNYPVAEGSNKTVTNHFLWDYYYQNTAVHNHKDLNDDTYQTYYETDRTYTSYPLLAGATPYLIGLPGSTYYEFDLSGNFEADNTKVEISKLGQQIITFASNTGIRIAVSDNESSNVEWSATGSKKYTLTFHSNYLNKNLAAGDYAMKADGSQFDKVTAEGGSAVEGGATAVPFRPYFTATAVAASRQQLPEHILFDGDHDGLEQEPESAFDGFLEVYVKGHKIITTSHLKQPTTVHIVSVSGVTKAKYVLQPGETVETPIQNAGVYIVNRKKVAIR